MPAPSWPSSIGNGVVPQLPFSIAHRSEWHTPLAAIRISTSPGLWWVDVERFDVDRSVPSVDDGSSCCSCHPRSSCVPRGGHASVSRMDVLALRDLAAARFDDFVATLAQMVNVDCGSYSPAGVNAIADLCEARFRDGGWEVERRPHDPADGASRLGDLLIGTLRGAGGPRILLVDTWTPCSTTAPLPARPFSIDGDIARGPGVSDMKGGPADRLLRGGGAAGGRVRRIRAHHLRLQPRRGDRIAVQRADRSRRWRPEFDAAFVLEGARANGDIVSARKGITDYTIDIVGRAAHAGVEPEKGRNALLAGRAHDHRAAGSQRTLAGRHGERGGRARAARAPTWCRNGARCRSISARRSWRPWRRPKPRSRASAPTR